MCDGIAAAITPTTLAESTTSEKREVKSVKVVDETGKVDRLVGHSKCRPSGDLPDDWKQNILIDFHDSRRQYLCTSSSSHKTFGKFPKKNSHACRLSQARGVI